MANRKSPARQAIKDMLELGFDVTFFTNNIRSIHMLNIEIGIVTKERAVKVIKKKKPKVNRPKPQTKSWTPKPQPKKHVYNQNITFNPDGTISLGFTHEWDYK